ncbi:MAG: hypothetical protein ABF991_12585 [Liquorilactobacillus hordei]|uniref:Thoeris anti-defense Tad2 family protein n=1 Tax=Liquorilactobacillus hordei TaxID=468911 RepID=UPI0039ED0118
MNISEAAKQAQKEGRGIARHRDDPRPPMFIATNTTAGVIILPDYKNANINWQPTLDDLVANDWFVTG